MSASSIPSSLHQHTEYKRPSGNGRRLSRRGEGGLCDADLAPPGRRHRAGLRRRRAPARHQAPGDILLKRAAAAGLKGTPAEPVSPHGLRAGFVTTAYRNGVPDEEIMGHTRHRSLTTMRSYAAGLPLASDSTHRLEPLAVPVGRITLILRRHLWVVAAVFLFGIGVTALVVKGMPRRYTAEVSILVEPQRTQVSDLQAISADPGDIGTVVRTQIDILRSPTLAVNVVKALNLTNEPEFVPQDSGISALLTTVLGRLGMKQVAPTRAPVYEDMVDIAAGLLSTKIAFFNEARSGVLRIDVTTQDPDLSANIANELARQFLDYKRQAKFAAMQRAHDWFQEQMGLLSEQLRASERDIEKYRREHRLDEDAAPDDSDVASRTATINRQQLDAISRQVSEASRDLALKEREMRCTAFHAV